MRVSEPPVVVQEIYDWPAEAIWRAITDVEEMRQWYFECIPAFEARVGFETEFTITNEGREFPHLWDVTEVEPGKKIVYGWRFHGYPGHGMVTFELEEQGGQTSLTLTNEVLEDFPDEIPEFRRESCLAGWQYLLGQSLREFLQYTA